MISELEAEVLSRIEPGEAEMKKARSLASRLCRNAEELAASKGVTVRGMVVGSLAKGTFMVGVDIDIFVLFPMDVPREKLEEMGLFIGHSLINGEERYAEHPYVHGFLEGYEIDVVPCYDVGSPSDKMSAVDRTPFHTRFVLENMDYENRRDVLLFKQFLKGVGVYGAEASIGGFSGYLCELLVLKYGGFAEILEAADSWKSGTHLSLRGEQGSFKEPLVFIDPVDAKRNVAAAVTSQAMGVFIHASRAYVESPDIRFFFPNGPEAITRKHAKYMIEQRGTHPLLIVIPRPSSVDDVLYPQINKFRRVVVERLSGEGFPAVHHHLEVSPIEILFFLELENGERPGIHKHKGPQIWGPNAVQFLEKWKDSGLSPPYIEDGYWVVDAPRIETRVDLVLERHIADWGIGKELKILASQRKVKAFSGSDALENMPQEMLSAAFDRRFPWMR